MVDGMSRTVDVAGRRVDGAGHPVDVVRKTVDGATRRVDGTRETVDGTTRHVDGTGHLVDVAGHLVDRMRRTVENFWRLMAQESPFLAQNQRFANRTSPMCGRMIQPVHATADAKEQRGIIMGKSFFNGSTDAELLSGSRNFAEKISVGWAAYGISEAMAMAYVALDAQWQAAYKASHAPDSRTTCQLIGKNDLRARVKAMASRLGKLISGNPNILDDNLASLGLSVRAKAAPLAEPGMPYRLSTKLDGDGSLILSWKCDNPAGSRGTQYELWRRIAGGDFVFLQTVGVKRFRDHTLPEGATGIAFKIRATRSTKTGPWTRFNVSIGGGMPSMFDLQLAA